ncbi:hydrolase [Thalassobacillus sp. CUG 92003]|uniref:hydrolase n=1 Tax=Thalassobacillus sp. CUG 92003 TaxID=2736641 RepID=UPI0015E6C3BC|nr:hydrolase [Thalassobacillus sp. CUG 92003]
MEKKKYFVNIGTREISVNHDANNDDFIIYANDEEIVLLREVFDEVYNADMRSFFRSHTPFKPYHQDADNDEFDEGMNTVFQKLYEYGDDMTRENIRSMDVLEDLED